jgi:succinate dehydrogenase / fumarate reductase membrane anchor subunit
MASTSRSSDSAALRGKTTTLMSNETVPRGQPGSPTPAQPAPSTQQSSLASDATALRDENVLRRVRRLGSARNGLREWQLQRKTAIALSPLGLYFVISMVRLATADHLTAVEWLSTPVPALLTILFVAALFAHALVGLRSVFLDYVHTRARLVVAEIIVHGAVILLAGASALAVLKLFLAR